MRSSSSSSSGIGFGGVLFCIFLTLKLTKVIDWSWWWVTAPLWIPISLALIVFAFMAFVMWMINK